LISSFAISHKNETNASNRFGALLGLTPNFRVADVIQELVTIPRQLRDHDFTNPRQFYVADEKPGFNEHHQMVNNLRIGVVRDAECCRIHALELAAQFLVRLHPTQPARRSASLRRCSIAASSKIPASEVSRPPSNPNDQPQGSQRGAWVLDAIAIGCEHSSSPLSGN
jgi:hypothetical protein